jgi:hypothetical protein
MKVFLWLDENINGEIFVSAKVYEYLVSFREQKTIASTPYENHGL